MSKQPGEPFEYTGNGFVYEWLHTLLAGLGPALLLFVMVGIVFAAWEMQELKRRQLAYRGNRSEPALCGKTVILIDDGIATGSTLRAAVPYGVGEWYEDFSQTSDAELSSTAPAIS